MELFFHRVEVILVDVVVEVEVVVAQAVEQVVDELLLVGRQEVRAVAVAVVVAYIAEVLS